MFTFADIHMDLDGMKVICQKRGFYTKFLKILTSFLKVMINSGKKDG